MLKYVCLFSFIFCDFVMCLPRFDVVVYLLDTQFVCKFL